MGEDSGPGGGALSLENRVAELWRRHLAPSWAQDEARSNDFANGGFYIQHHVPALAGLRESVLALAYEADEGYRSWVDKRLKDKEAASPVDMKLIGFALRYFYESEAKESLPLRKAAIRLFNMDFEDGTEWGQGYFSQGAGRTKNARAGIPCANPGEALASYERETLCSEIGATLERKAGPRI